MSFRHCMAGGVWSGAPILCEGNFFAYCGHPGFSDHFFNTQNRMQESTRS